MQNNQITIFLVGLAQFSLLAYSILKLKQQLKQAQKQKNKFKQAFYKSGQFNIDTKLLKQKTKYYHYKKPHLIDKVYEDVVITNIKPIINQNTFRLRILDLPIKQHPLSKTQFLKNSTGGKFECFCQGIKLICHLNCTHIATSTLQKRKSDVKIFKQNNQKSYRKNVLITLSSATFMALYGRLTFDIETKSFNIDTKFLVSSIFQIQKFWQSKIDSIKGKIAVGLFVTIFICYIFLLTPIIYLYVRTKNSIKKLFKKELQHFKKLLCFKTNPQWKLMCPECNKHIQDIIFQCGHIGFCHQCRDKGMSKCPICFKKSSAFLQIYFS